jgi:adenine-specific DNA-methyltransferase
VQRLLSETGLWLRAKDSVTGGATGEPVPTDKNPGRTLLEKHQTDYTARNTFDYFIHKDLGGFLRRELDIYIKNEVMHLDDIESDTARGWNSIWPRSKPAPGGRQIIDFLAQVEDFQKELWLKKKFVVETQYCVTLDRIYAIEDENKRDSLLNEIVKNDPQREEWVRLHAIDELEGDLVTPGYSEPLSKEFLQAHPTLMVDTRHFDGEFKLGLLSAIADLDEETDGLLIHSENFQALSLLQARYRAQVQCVYIDPPYNSKTTEIAYKNNYKHSSWVALIEGRLGWSKYLSTQDGSHIVAIDENEQEVLGCLLSTVFPDYFKGCVAVVHNKKGIQGDYFSHSHEYAYFCIPPTLSRTHGFAVPESDGTMTIFESGDESRRGKQQRTVSIRSLSGKASLLVLEMCVMSRFHPGTANVSFWPRHPRLSGGFSRG